MKQAMKRMVRKAAAVLLGTIVGLSLLVLASITFSVLPAIIQMILAAAGVVSFLICFAWLVLLEAKLSYYRACRDYSKDGN